MAYAPNYYVGGDVTLRAVEVLRDDFELTQGDQVEVAWTSSTADQWPDLTGATLAFRAFEPFGSLELTPSVVAPDGTQRFKISPTRVQTSIPSGVYAYDVQASWVDGTRQTLARGEMTIKLTYTDVP